MDSVNMLCMPLYSPVVSFTPRPQQHSTAMAARIGAAKVQGFRWEDSPIYSLHGPRSTLPSSAIAGC